MPLPALAGWSAERLAAHPTIVLDGTGTVVYASDALLRLTGLPREQVIGSSAPNDPAMARAFEGGREFLLNGSMSRIGMRSGELAVPARPGPTVRCHFEYEGVPKGAPQYHVFVFEPIGSEPPGRRAVRMEGALYEIQHVLDGVGLPGPRREMPEHVELAGLTDRELDVVKLLLEGGSNDQVARQLHVSLHTVKSHVQAIFRKLEVRSRAELLARFVSGAEGTMARRRTDGH